MNRFVLCFIGAALCSAPALAQSAAPDQTVPGVDRQVTIAQNDQDDQGPGRRGWRRNDERNDGSYTRGDQGRSQAGDWRDAGAGPSQQDSRQGPRAGMMSHEWRMQHMAGPAQEQAHFRMRRGTAAVDISCPAGPDLAACVDAAGRLFDKLDAAPAAPAAPAQAAPAH